MQDCAVCAQNVMNRDTNTGVSEVAEAIIRHVKPFALGSRFCLAAACSKVDCSSRWCTSSYKAFPSLNSNNASQTLYVHHNV